MKEPKYLFAVELKPGPRSQLEELAAKMGTTRGAVVRLGIGALYASFKKQEGKSHGSK